MRDRFGRIIEYLRLSVIDRCNLNCMYCLPDAQSACRLLSSRQIVQIVEAMAGLGIRKVRLTGGEPLMRRDLEEMVAGIAAIDGIEDIPMTTNAVGLDGRLNDLLDAGLTRLNISLDSLQPETYAQITGRDRLPEVLRAIDRSLSLGLDLKLNVVVMRDINGDEIDDFIAFARTHPLELRFIELMPIGKYGEKNRDQMLSGSEIIAAHPELLPIGRNKSGVAELYTGPGFRGQVGLITPISHGFCESCNRVRVTSDGKLKLCLGQNNELNLLPILETQPEQLQQTIHDAIYNKPHGHVFSQPYISSRGMGQIGG